MTTMELTVTLVVLGAATGFALIGTWADNSKAGVTGLILFAADIGLAMLLSL
jgi:hypothetical protein